MTYTSKAAQNRDLDALNREYSRITDDVKAFELPFYLYEIRAKRLDAVQEAGHISADLRAEIERLVERRAEIKATPIGKRCHRVSESAFNYKLKYRPPRSQSIPSHSLNSWRRVKEKNASDKPNATSA